MVDTLSVFWDEAMLAHNPPAGEFEAEWTGRLAVEEPHPDRPGRVQNIKHILETELDEQCEWKPVEPAAPKEIQRVHTEEYIENIREFSVAGGGRLTAETGANEHTYRAARYAVGAATGAARTAVAAESATVPYALVRPSGHHAQPAQADGYCFFNNAALAAEVALEHSDIERVAILDWDVHHGNGTQEVFYDRDDVLFISVHNDHGSWDPVAHPQSGDLAEHGVEAGEGYTVNVPLPPGTGDRGYEVLMDELVAPILTEYGPDLLVVSAGQDAGTVDPLGRNVVTMDGFRMLGARVQELAGRLTDNRVVVLQEGGYQMSHLAYATLGVFEGMLDVDTGVQDPFDWLDEDYDSAERALDAIATYQSRFWGV